MGSLTPLDLGGVPFKRKRIAWTSTRGTRYARWVPFGMPQLGDFKWITDTVFFLYPSITDAQAGTAYGGTGLFVAVPSTRWPDQYWHVHGVTNWHVACRGSSVIRVNRLDGTTPDTFDFDPSEWTYRPGWHDLAISPPLPIDPAVHKAEAIGLDALLTPGEIEREDIGAAEDIFMIGRFVDYEGSETNVPAFRFGNISIPNASIKQETGFTGPSLILDMHSRTGFSGSPVFIYRTPGSVFAPGVDLSVTWRYMKLLGLHWGQFPERWELRDASRAASLATQASMITDGKYVEGLSGMTCAVAADAIRELLSHPDLVRMRSEQERAVEPEILQSGLRPRAMANTQPLPGHAIRSEIERNARSGMLTHGQAVALGHREWDW